MSEITEIILDFQIDNNSFRKRVPTRLCIKGVDLLGQRKEDKSYIPYFPVWMPKFAQAGMWCLIYVKWYGETGISDESGIDIDFELREDLVLIRSTFMPDFIEIDYKKIYAAWKNFGEKVYRVLSISKTPVFKPEIQKCNCRRQ